MEYRDLGKTGLRVSALSLGGASLGGVFGTLHEDDGIRTVHTALDLGINFIDVAPYYGCTAAETVLGRALRSVPRERYYLSTKIGRYDLADFDFSAQRVASSVDDSLQRLGVEHLDLVLCHDIEFGDIDQIVDETLPALRRLRDRGKVRFVGFSGLPLKIYRAVLERTQVDAVISYCHYTLYDQTLATLLGYFKAKDVGVINASPLGMGLLSDRGPQPWHPAPAELRDACARAAAHCRARGSDIAKLAIQFAAACPGVATTLSGAAGAEEVRRNIAWVAEPIDQDLLREVQALLQPVHNQTWLSGRAENN